MNDLAVPTGREKHDGGRPVSGVLKARGEQVALHVVDAEKRSVEAPCHRLGKRKADHQRSGKAGAPRGRDGVELLGMHAGLGERQVHQWSDGFDVSSCRHLGHDTAEPSMEVGLTCQNG